MKQPVSFAELVDAGDELSPEEQETLSDILRHRVAEARRRTIRVQVREARQQYGRGRCEPATTAEIMKEILS